MRDVLGADSAWRLVILLIFIAWIVIGGMKVGPSLSGMFVVGVVVCLTAGWAHKWEHNNIGTAVTWLTLSLVFMFIYSLSEDGGGWKWKAPMVSAGLLGIGISELFVLFLRKGWRRNRK